MPAIHRKSLVWLILTISTSPSKTTIQIAIDSNLDTQVACNALSSIMVEWPIHVPVLVQVHFDCRFRGIDAVSSRYARTLGGNRTIAEVCMQKQLSSSSQQPPLLFALSSRGQLKQAGASS
jgi:hypothetical protein